MKLPGLRESAIFMKGAQIWTRTAIAILACLAGTNPTLFVDKCVWTAAGGNMSSAKSICNKGGGTVFTFNRTEDGVDTLDILNISRSTPIFIGAIRTRENNSAYFDWLSRPGTWSLDTGVNSTIGCQDDESGGNDCICIQLKDGDLSLTNCSSFLPITICENDDVQTCSGEGTPHTFISSGHMSATVTTSSTNGGPNMPSLPDQSFTEPPAISTVPASDAGTNAHGPHLDCTDTVTSPDVATSFNSQDAHCNFTDEPTVNSTNDDVDFGELFEVPDKNGSRWTDFSGLLAKIISSSNQSNAATEQRTSKEVDPGELMIIPDENGTRVTNFSDLLSEILGKSNISQALVPSSASTVTRLLPQTTGSEVEQSTMWTGVPVKEAFFKTVTESKPYPEFYPISGIFSGAVPAGSFGIPGPPWSGPVSPCLLDATKTLQDLVKRPTADNQTLMTFANTVANLTKNRDISLGETGLKRDLFSDIMQVGEDLVQKIPTSITEMFLSTENLNIYSKVLPLLQNSSAGHVDIDNQPQDSSEIQLSSQIFSTTVDSGIHGVRVSTITYKDMDKMETLLKASNQHISSPVISVTVRFLRENQTEERKIHSQGAIKFTVKTILNQVRQEEERQCTFWNFLEKVWSPKGCQVISKNSSHTTCECNHLTNFAILVMYVETKDISVESQQALYTLTTVGCSLSIACLIMTLICYIYLRMLSREKIMIHANLCVALLLAQIVFVSSHDAHRDHIACKVVAILLHFLFMAAFTWMMVEGIALYLCCTKGIFHHRDMRVKYFLLGWGLPLVIVVVSLAARFPDYGNGPQYSCWLSVRDGLIWAFLGPMLVIVVLNIGVMGLVVKAFLTLKSTSEKTNVARLRGSLRAMMTLLPLLGLTWILSLLVPYSVVFNYFFVIANTVQGMCIFFLHCICNEEVRKKFYEKRRRWSTTRTGSDADMTFPSRRKTGSFDAIRVTAASTPQPVEYASRAAWS